MSRTSKPPIALYSALADVTRCRIIEILANGPIPVHRLADEFSISRPAISRHLRVLKQAGLVAEVKKGRENLYAFRPRKLDKAIGWIETLRAANEVGEPKPVPVVDMVAPQPIVVAATPEDMVRPKKTRSAEKLDGPKAAINQMGFDF
ncbi:ArsR/SmtB family transcription factor [Devosia faecipullorum]|uniref:ArsR/SmtB family transcription factor n=1 Tax=Devosia faecipullorum TaxID=2755039 RepID=UPI00187BA981|nr:metalloregulator ArsR/SmtB family transcription factor [Devosia faecipullorum]MBE7731787.1 winged helix-turn-helix transcriptional regulator [Devosia faecipullorum]